MNTGKSGDIKKPLNTKDVFMKCGTCSQTFGHLLNREFGNSDENAELALDPLAGGIANQGHQCGMLWGASLAIGMEAHKRFQDEDQAIVVAVAASQLLVESFVKKTDTVNCKEIIGYDLSNVFGMVAYMIKTISKGMKNSQCFNLAEDWAPDAILAGSEELNHEPVQLDYKPKSCASEVVKKLGGSTREATMIAGYAGGLGLSGKGCGALAAAIWFNSLKWCEDNPGKRPAMFNNPIAKRLLKVFREETNSCMDCEEISACHFENIEEHSEYIANGGCNKLINLLANATVV